MPAGRLLLHDYSRISKRVLFFIEKYVVFCVDIIPR